MGQIEAADDDGHPVVAVGHLVNPDSRLPSFGEPGLHPPTPPLAAGGADYLIFALGPGLADRAAVNLGVMTVWLKHGTFTLVYAHIALPQVRLSLLTFLGVPEETVQRRPVGPSLGPSGMSIGRIGNSHVQIGLSDLGAQASQSPCAFSRLAAHYRHHLAVSYLQHFLTNSIFQQVVILGLLLRGCQGREDEIDAVLIPVNLIADGPIELHDVPHGVFGVFERLSISQAITNGMPFGNQTQAVEANTEKAPFHIPRLPVCAIEEHPGQSSFVKRSHRVGMIPQRHVVGCAAGLAQRLLVRLLYNLAQFEQSMPFRCLVKLSQ